MSLFLSENVYPLVCRFQKSKGTISATGTPSPQNGDVWFDQDSNSVLGYMDGSSQAVSTGGPAPSIRQVATRNFISKQINATNKSFMSRIWHAARLAPGEILHSVQVVAGNFYDPNNGETGTGGIKTATGSIEYPANTFNQILWGGSPSVQIASGSFVVSDPVTLQVPIPNGAIFWERYFYNNPTAVDFTTVYDPNNDLAAFGPAGTITDQTLGGTIVQNTPGIASGFLAIIGRTRQPGVLIIGDSRSLGLKDGPAAFAGAVVSNPYTGTIAPSIAPNFPFINASVSGSTTAFFLSGTNSWKVGAAKYCTHVIDALGINDITGGATPATTFTNQASIAALYPGLPFYLTTLSPVTTTTDNWTTLANQTVNANNTNFQTYNEQVRSSKQLSYVTDIFDIASVTEAGMGSGIWIAAPALNIANYATADGTHENEVGNRLIKNSGVVNPAKIHI